MRRVRSWPLRRTVLLLGSAGLSLAISGCFTTYVVQEAVGQRATLEFRLSGAESPRPVVHWKEVPAGNEAVLFLKPPLTDCAAVEIYANPVRGSLHRLSGKPTVIHPLAPAQDGAATEDPWSVLPAGPCTVLLTVGPQAAAGSSGLSASTRREEFFRFEFPMNPDVPMAKGLLFAAVYESMVADIILTPLLGVAYVAAKTWPDGEDPADATVVSFDFPDGARREVSLVYSEAKQLLEDRLGNSDFGRWADTEPWNFTRFWTTAALLRLEMDFRLTVDKEGQHPVLFHAGGWSGPWRFGLRYGQGEMSDLSQPIGETRYIRFWVVGGERALKPGSSKAQVLAAMGAPWDRSFQEQNQAWQYMNMSGPRQCDYVTVWFQGEVLHSVTSRRGPSDAGCLLGSEPVDWGQFKPNPIEMKMEITPELGQE